MFYEFENGDWAVITGDDFWATLTIYNKDGKVLEKQISESFVTLMKYLRDKVQELRKTEQKKKD